MNQIRSTIWNKRLPTFAGFFIFAFALLTIGWLSTNSILFGTKAAIDETPKNIHISNITDTSFTVTYTTDEAVPGSIQYGKTNDVKQVIFDDKDKANNTPTETTIHSITVPNLTPATAYSFTIISGSQTFSDNDKPYSVSTGTALSQQPSKKLLSGKLILSSGTPPPEALVLVSTTNSQMLSTTAKTDGTYQIDLGSLRDTSLNAFTTLSDTTVIQMIVLTGKEQSTVSLTYKQIANVPLITLSNNYNFLVSGQPISSSPDASESATPNDSSPAFPTTEIQAPNSPQILTPQEEQEFKDQQPLFKGKAVPNKTVNITINSEQTITTTVKADANGNWEYRPDETLEPGEHTITIRTEDASGLIRTITKSFVVYAEGGQFTEPSISPSQGTPSPTQTQPTAVPTANPSTKPTTAPTQQVTSSPTTTTTPTKTIAPSPTTANPSIPITGNSATTTIIIVVFSVIAIGALLFVFAAV